MYPCSDCIGEAYPMFSEPSNASEGLGRAIQDWHDRGLITYIVKPSFLANSLSRSKTAVEDCLRKLYRQEDTIEYGDYKPELRRRLVKHITRTIICGYVIDKKVVMR